MRINLLCIGKTDDKEIAGLVKYYQNRLPKHWNFEITEIADVKNAKNLSPELLKKEEAKLFLTHTENSDFVVLLDENGKTFSSVGFSDFLQKKMNAGIKTLVFVIGGPYGFSETVYQKAQGKVSLSEMTFSHQMVRLFVIEQIYRGFTILRNEPYHHQ